MIEKINAAIENRKKEFMLHNIVRLREMIRYLPQNKLDLFREIPFLIHINSPEYPAYVKSAGNIFGVWNFQHSGFAKDLLAKKPQIAPLLSSAANDPGVQGIYHIGSLGTFTQSAKSDFDFWIVIDNARFDAPRLKALHQKLNLIIIHSRKRYAQEVSFFVHDATNLVNNQFDEGDDDELITVPKMLIKEEFYRTFIMVAGKIPLWAVIPSGLNDNESETWKAVALNHQEFIDLGILKHLPVDEIQRGLLWQICKAHYDPVKALIKATVTASYLQALKNQAEEGKLLCDGVKDRFSQSIIDDYAADPYILAFQRVLQFCEAMNDPTSLAQIKAAIFFRLCSFPLVMAPPPESPKRKILDRYIRQWHLSGKQLKKLLDYQNWEESEKCLFDHTMIQRISQLYQMSLSPKGQHRLKDMETHSHLSATTKLEDDSHILHNKALKIMKTKKGRIATCSIFLRFKPHAKLILIPRSGTTDITEEKQTWLLFSQKNKRESKPKLIYTAPYPTQVMGWCFANHLFTREASQLEIQSSLTLSTSFNKVTGFDELYLNLEPWMPLSDGPFAASPYWEKIVVILTDYTPSPQGKNRGEDALPLPRRAECLARNSWGEIFFEAVDLPQTDNPDETFNHIAKKIMMYHSKPEKKAPAYTIFQFTDTLHPEAIKIIKTIVEDTKLISRKDGLSLMKASRRPYLDRI